MSVVVNAALAGPKTSRYSNVYGALSNNGVLPNYGRTDMLGSGSSALSRLTTLIDSLGGILWLPNQHNYVLTTDTAVAPVGDPVGYMGSHRQNLPENWIKDTQFAGGTPGTPGTMPTGWLKASTGSGLSTELVSSGSGFIVVRIFGTATGTGAVDLVANTANNTVMAPAKQHQLWSGAFDVELVAGTWSASKVRGSLNEFDGSAFLVNSTAFINGAGRLIVTRALTSAACQYAYISLAYIPAVSEVVDLTLKISAPQLERGKPTAFTPTYGEAITRGANFEPAWQDTTANKALLGKGGKNLALHSNDFSQAVWAKNNTSLSGERLTRTSTVAGCYVGQYFNSTAATGNTYSARVKVKAGAVGGYFGLRLHAAYPERVDIKVNLSDGTYATAATTAILVYANVTAADADGYYTVVLAMTVVGTGTTQRVVVGPTDVASSAGSWEGASAVLSDCYVKECMVVSGSYTASDFPAYVATTSAPAFNGVGDACLDYDGSNDFYRTGIQTPEAGYIAGVWTHDGTASGRTLFASSRDQTTPIGVSVHLQYTHGLSVGRSNGTIETIALSSIPVPTNVKTIVDGYYSTTGSTSRVNGANEGTNVVAANAASTNYFRIGAAFNGTAEERFYKGTMLAQVWIPGARPGATTEAEIRRLLAEITAVSGVV